MTDTIDNMKDLIDSRDVIARIEELRDELADLESEANDDTNAAANETREQLVAWREEYAQELADLEALQTEAEGYAPDWHYGETLIRDTYFKEYAQELAEDIGAIDSNATWPNTCIDWDQAARELQMDYTCVDFAGVDYWIR